MRACVHACESVCVSLKVSPPPSPPPRGLPPPGYAFPPAGPRGSRHGPFPLQCCEQVCLPGALFLTGLVECKGNHWVFLSTIWVKRQAAALLLEKPDWSDSCLDSAFKCFAASPGAWNSVARPQTSGGNGQAPSLPPQMANPGGGAVGNGTLHNCKSPGHGVLDGHCPKNGIVRTAQVRGTQTQPERQAPEPDCVSLYSSLRWSLTSSPFSVFWIFECSLQLN